MLQRSKLNNCTSKDPLGLETKQMGPTLQVNPLIYSGANTILLADQQAGNFDTNNPKWVVSVQENQTFQDLTQKITHGEVDVTKKIIFVMLGTVQFRALDRGSSIRMILRLSQAVMSKNPCAKQALHGGNASQTE